MNRRPPAINAAYRQPITTQSDDRPSGAAQAIGLCPAATR
jgi:hypothetical protein